ncbi:nuclear transport factor 2 family protein [Bdellovibrio sp. SKB1291214]|uniref:nuclear transport factor 2 family protein n=1 Tax=Bdellovibrio sp. SKB1291214 TaxID=1732569 RepID=UPI000B51B1F0|nr:nuclear transport factor 2 family protein [Bdellovibrio sp. SKB1291214]UYL08850.1 nuclear transport factor 2 family protein [Bdellovibrio sp. SKB1291214]
MKTKEELRQQAQNTFQAHLDNLSSGKVDEWVNLWAEDGVLEFPFKLPVYPGQVEGKAMIREYMRHFPETIKLEFSKPTFHLTEDPELVVAEFTAKGHMLANGNPYNQTYISLVYTKDGKITRYKDFWDPLVAMTALGENNNYQGAIATL